MQLSDEGKSLSGTLAPDKNNTSGSYLFAEFPTHCDPQQRHLAQSYQRSFARKRGLCEFHSSHMRAGGPVYLLSGGGEAAGVSDRVDMMRSVQLCQPITHNRMMIDAYNAPVDNCVLFLRDDDRLPACTDMAHSLLMAPDFNCPSDRRAEIDNKQSQLLVLLMAEGNEQLIQDMTIIDWLYSGATNRGFVQEESLVSVHISPTELVSGIKHRKFNEHTNAPFKQGSHWELRSS
ncbi:hypothetical protein EDD18DRAFT_205932 [Armillaria luteobubalina]|uniref:Uncharacterized protein n=1 Tax=Armillaria luteobubalina TaxID=153913 RepID=A0AA39TP30_9AGAR|nr:hypothetical protein EDD18DRAFT_205932 [Armillaria luteobubalina]